MAKLVAGSMALWMILAVCLTDLIDANGNDGWESVTQFQRDSNISKNNFKYFANIESGECNNESLEKDNAFTSIWGFTESLKFVMDNKEKLPELYTSAEDSLKHYLTKCGLEERYQKMIQQLASDKGEQTDSASEQTLATQMWSALSDSSVTQRDIFWAIQIVRAEEFPLAKIQCPDTDYIRALKVGLELKCDMPLRDYSLNLFQKHLKDCGHEDFFERFVKQSLDPTSVEKKQTFYQYLRSGSTVGSKYIWPIKIVVHLASITGPELNCRDDIYSRDYLTMAERYRSLYPTLMDYAIGAIKTNMSACLERDGRQRALLPETPYTGIAFPK